MKKIFFAVLMFSTFAFSFANSKKYNYHDWRNFVGVGVNGDVIPYCQAIGIKAIGYYPDLKVEIWRDLRLGLLDFYYPNPDRNADGSDVDFSDATKIQAHVERVIHDVKVASLRRDKKTGFVFRGFVFLNPMRKGAEGRLAFMDSLRKEALKLRGDAKFIFVLDDISESWVKPIAKIADAKKSYAGAFPDLLLQKKRGTAFLDDKSIYADGSIKKSDVGRACFENAFNITAELRDCAKTAINGSWSTFADLLGESGFSDINSIPARLKISTLIPMWENLNNTPLSERVYDEESKIYYSPTAYMAKDAIGALCPIGNKKFYFVFNEPNARVMIPKGYTVKTINTITKRFTFYPYVRKPFKGVQRDDGKLFKIAMWMSPKKPNMIMENDDGFLYLLNDSYTNEAFMAELEPKK